MLLSNVKSNPTLKAEVSQRIETSKDLRFLENKGQMADMQRKAMANLLFKASSPGVDIYITTIGLSYVFTHTEELNESNSFDKVATERTNESGMETQEMELEERTKLQYCRADMELVGADIQKENIIKAHESEDYNNYYIGGICPDGILNVHSYTQITLKNIYPGIDWVIFSSQQQALNDEARFGGLKYNFIVHPGADISVIKLRYKWTDKPILQNNGSLKIVTPMGTITEGAPLSFAGSSENIITTRYKVLKEYITFDVGNYNINDTLVIDPTLEWGTYYGGSSLEEVYSLHNDGTNVWVTGNTTSTDFPILNSLGGAYFQGTIVGNPPDAYILKFNTSGNLIWCTYYGGNNLEVAYSITSDGTNIWLTGMTGSADFPTYNPFGGAYFQGVRAGPFNAFILQFTIAGVRKWATYYGGNLSDGGYSISSDGANVWVTGYANSSNFPTLNPLSGAYFQGVYAGNQDAFILQFNTSGVRVWATYYGGSNIDFGQSIHSDGTNVNVAGYTLSTNFPTLNPLGGAFFQGASGGSYDAFIFQFNISGIRYWSTYYGGSGDDRASSITCDGSYICVTGYTTSTNFPTLNPFGGTYFQGLNAGVSDAFVLKFNSAGLRQWATYYGGSGNDKSFSIDYDGTNIWVSGLTMSADFPVQPAGCSSFFQGTLMGGTIDVYILQFNTPGIRQWATYYGKDVENDGSYVSSDGTYLFVSGDAQNGGAYPFVDPGAGAWYKTTLTGTENIFMARFCILCGGMSATIIKTDLTCNTASTGTASAIPVGGTTPYTFLWSDSGAQTNVTATGLGTGTYTVTVNDAGTCTTTASTNIIAPSPLTGQFTKGTANCANCGCKEWLMVTSIGGTSPYTYTWPAFTGYDKRYKNQLCPGTYIINIKDKNGCNINVSVSTP